MENKIINGEEYVKKSEVKGLKQKDFMIMNNENVMAIVPIERDSEIEDTIEIEDFGTFKRYEEDFQLGEVDKQRLETKIIIVSKSRYSLEYVNIAKETAKAFGKGTDFNIYIRFDKGKFKKDEPALFVFDNLVFMLAPRILDDYFGEDEYGKERINN